MHIPKELKSKLESKSSECVFLQYNAKSKAYKLWDKVNNKIVISKDVIFHEDA